MADGRRAVRCAEAAEKDEAPSMHVQSRNEAARRVCEKEVKRM